MSEAVVVAIITGGFAVFGQYLIARKNRQEDEYQRGQRDKHLDDQISSLSDRVDEHNNYAKLFASVTKDISNLTTEIKLLAQDIKYIKEGKLK